MKNKILKFLVLLLPFGCGFSQAETNNPADKHSDCAKYIIPTPKNLQFNGTIRYTGKKYSFSNKTSLPEASCKWLEDSLSAQLDWQLVDSAADFSINLLPGKALDENKESYTLTINRNNITIAAANNAGMVRGIGRLLCIIELPSSEKTSDGSIVMPLVEINDWPDFSQRFVHFQLCREYTPERENMLLREIDVMAKLGYNSAWVEIGGRINVKSHPELTRHPAWPDNKLQELIKFADARGIKLFPATNSIGHMPSSPKIFPLSGDRRKGEKIIPTKELVMDISHPDFYKIWFDYLDELCKTFTNPGMVHIGTDEFHHGIDILSEKTGKPFHEYYPEFLNRTNRYLKSKNTRMSIWHDMLFDQQQYSDSRGRRYEEANGKKGLSLDKIDPDIIINYWQYSVIKNHPILERIVKEHGSVNTGIVLWLTYENARIMAPIAKTMGINLLGTSTWGLHANSGAIPQNAEYFWNIQSSPLKTEQIIEEINDRFFFRRNENKPSLLEAFQLTDKKTTVHLPEFKKLLAQIFPENILTSYGLSIPLDNMYFFYAPDKTPSPEILYPWNFKDLDGQTLSYYPEGSIECRKDIFKINRIRSGEALFIYTPDFGKSSMTNIFGVEFALKKNIIIAQSDNPDFALQYKEGNMQIPADGCVFSWHTSLNADYRRRTNGFYDSLKPGTRLILRKASEQPAPQHIQVPIKLKTQKKLFIFLTAAYPFNRKDILAEIELSSSDIKKVKMKISGNDFIYFSDRKDGWTSWNACPEEHRISILGIEWNGESSDYIPESLKITATPEGVQCGLTILGIGI